MPTVAAQPDGHSCARLTRISKAVGVAKNTISPSLIVIIIIIIRKIEDTVSPTLFGEQVVLHKEARESS